MSLKKGVRNGTISGQDSPLCNSCSNALIKRGAAESQREVFCNAIYPTQRVKFEVFECNEYVKKSDPEMKRLEDIAWIIRANPKQKGTLGFFSPVQMKKIKADEGEPI